MEKLAPAVKSIDRLTAVDFGPTVLNLLGLYSRAYAGIPFLGPESDKSRILFSDTAIASI